MTFTRRTRKVAGSGKSSMEVTHSLPRRTGRLQILTCRLHWRKLTLQLPEHESKGRSLVTNFAVYRIP
ncbi:MAG: hypothetical protein BJ554DRAFT_899 [Olpidium bornovanus]|uniref:Uncharacterized protein n=1 Tax=Olpidium bornovanus TaxID=278681 RepID=A0A8H8A146_9FUNG|nr:MAG: hypothetical protein BJ554DRAFT_899 [Olpidium bornovanus]